MSADDPKDTQPKPPLPTTQRLPPQRAPMLNTGRLGIRRVLPWVVELRISGTPNTIQLQVRETMIVGRGLSNDPDRPIVDMTPYGGLKKGVSRQHAAILARKQFLTIRDLNSTNGTRLNGFRLDPHQDVPIEHGDEIVFGELKVQVQYAVLPPETNRELSDDLDDTNATVPLGEGREVLVVEDDADVAMAYSMMLQHYGYRVTTADNPAEILERLGKRQPDAVVLDLILDGFGGLDLVHLLTQETKGKVPLLVVSGMTAGHHRQKALDAGATAFLGKPVRVDDLVAKVNELIMTPRSS